MAGDTERATRGDGAPDGFDELLGLLDGLSEHLETVSAQDAPVGSREVAGPGGQAQENRAIHRSRARSAAERARDARPGLAEVAERARALTEELRRERALRAGRREARERAAVAADTAGAAGGAGGIGGVVAVEDPAAVLDHVVRGAATRIPGVDHAGVSVRDRQGDAVRSAAGDDVARALGAVRSRAGEDPFPRAGRIDVVEIRDLAADDVPRSRLTATALRLGVRSLLSVRLDDGSRTGSLDLYRRAAGTFDDASRLAAQLVSRHAGVALAGAERIQGLLRAVESRDLIGQAKGVLMVRRGVGADEAFRMIVESSQDTNLKVVDVARWVVDTMAGDDPAGG